MSSSYNCLDCGELNAFSALSRAYTQFDDRIAPFYAGDYRDDEAHINAVRATLSVKRDREVLADVLLEQNEKWGADEAVRENIEALRSPKTAVVVTGQQVGLFLGPLYTIYKTLSTIQLASRLSRETGDRVVPVFWLGGEDHDFEEVQTAHFLENEALVSFTYNHKFEAHGGNRGPVGLLVLTTQIKENLRSV